MSGLRRSAAVVAALVAGASLVSAGPAQAAATATLARYELNEAVGARTMTDSGGAGIHGAIGSAVQTGYTYSGATGYLWGVTNPNEAPAKPERLIQVGDSRLNPGTRDFAVTVRYRHTRQHGNLIQKGQNGARGGYFKIEVPQGLATCLFKDADGRQRAIKATTALNDGAWHTVRCEKTSTSIAMTIDNGPTKRQTGTMGSISNTVPLTIGGKLNCDQVKITCDYFSGAIDWIHLQTS